MHASFMAFARAPILCVNLEENKQQAITMNLNH